MTSNQNRKMNRIDFAITISSFTRLKISFTSIGKILKAQPWKEIEFSFRKLEKNESLNVKCYRSASYSPPRILQIYLKKDKSQNINCHDLSIFSSPSALNYQRGEFEKDEPKNVKC